MTAASIISWTRVACIFLSALATSGMADLRAQEPLQAVESRAADSQPASHPSGFRRTTIDLEITGADTGVESHGSSKTITYTARSTGTLILSAFSGSIDLSLRATREPESRATLESAPASAPAAFEDENGGGYPTPCLELVTQAGWTWVIGVTASTTPPESRPASGPSLAARTGPAKLSLVEVPESDASLALAREVTVVRAEIKRLAAGGARDVARQRVKDLVDRLLAQGATEMSVAGGRDLFLLGLDARALGDIEDARRCWQRVTEFYGAAFPDDYPDLQAARLNLASTIKLLGDLRGARRLEEAVLEVRERTLPDDHPDLQKTRGNLAGTIATLGENPAARKLFEKVLEVRLRTLPADDTNVQVARLNLAVILNLQGDVEEAHKLFASVVDVFSRTLPDDDPDLQKARLDLGATTYLLGDYDSARGLFEKVVDVFARKLADDHPDLQRARLNLAMTFLALGDLEGARRLEEKVLEIRSRALPDDHPDLLTSRLSLAVTVEAFGDFERARKLEERVLEIRSRTLSEDHPDLQDARHVLAITLMALEDFEAARRLQERVLEVRSRTLSDDHPDLQAARHNLAMTLRALGDPAGARALQEKVLAADSRKLPEDHPELQRALLNLAGTLAMLGDLSGARRLEEEVLEVRSRTLPDDHPELQSARHNVVVTRFETGDHEGCRRIVADLLRGARCRAGLMTLTDSPREVLARLGAGSKSLDLALTVIGSLPPKPRQPSLDADLFWTIEQGRARLLVTSRLRHLLAGGAIQERVDAARTRAQIATAEIARHAKRGASREMARAVLERDSAEREMIGLLGQLPEASKRATEPTASALASRLRPDQALIAFARYGQMHLGGTETRSNPTPRYVAWVLRPGPSLVRIDLGEASAIEEAVEHYGVAIRASARADAKARLDVSTRATQIRRLVVDPLEAALSGATDLTMAPSAALFLVPFDALPDKDGMLGDHRRVHVRSTLQETLQDLPSSSLEPSFLGLGGIDYDATPDHVAKTTGSSAPAIDAVRGAEGKRFDDLPGTGKEVRAIAESFRSAFGEARSCRILDEENASKHNFMSAAPKARFLHFATHGFFAASSVPCITDPNPIDPRLDVVRSRDSRQDAIGFSPMVLCGLALAGANRPEDQWGHIEGCITAEEIASMNVSGCELCVLSACDTGRGTRAGMGIASLQTALHAAGVRTAITSLWKVPDEATRELMTDFYRRMWIEKKPKWQALWEAKVRLRDMLDENGRPRYTLKDWAAWVLTGEPD